MRRQNVDMSVKMEAWKQVITNLHDLLKAYQTVMYSHESQLQ